MEVARRRGRRRKKLLDDLKDRIGYSHLKEEALDRTIWRHPFGGGFGPVVRQNTEWMNECTKESPKTSEGTSFASGSDVRLDVLNTLEYSSFQGYFHFRDRGKSAGASQKSKMCSDHHTAIRQKAFHNRHRTRTGTVVQRELAVLFFPEIAASYRNYFQ